MNQPSLQQEMSTYADVKARCARIVTRLEAIATDPNARPQPTRATFSSGLNCSATNYEAPPFASASAGGRRVTAEGGHDASV